MLRFELEEMGKITKSSLLKMSLVDIIDDRRHFVVYLDDKVYFEDIYFPVKEFTKYAFNWMKVPEKDFIFNTIDDYQNPLLAFRRLRNGWKLQSVWQKFECDSLFTEKEVKEFVNKIISQIVE